MSFRSLGRYLKEKRMEKGLTQRQVAESLGEINPQFVSNWERGLCAPPSHAFHDLIDYLNVNRKRLCEVMLEDARTVIESKVYPRRRRR